MHPYGNNSPIKKFLDKNAEKLFDDSIKRFPDCIEAYPNLANVLVAKGRNDIAKNILLSLIHI